MSHNFEIVLLLSICSTPQYCASQFYNRFITDYFSLKCSSSLIVHHCNDKRDTVQLIRQLSELQIKSVFRTFETEINHEWPSLIKVMNSRVGLVFDLQCQINEQFKLLLHEASDYRMFDELFSWLVIASDLQDTLEIVNDEYFGLSTDFVIAVKEKYSYILYDIYNPCKKCGGILNVTRIGTWSGKYGFHLISKFYKSNRWNLQGLRLKISGLVNQKPENMSLAEHIKDYNSKHIDTTVKLSYALWLPLSEMYNFTIIYQEKNVWKKGDKNGPVMNDLQSGDADATGTPITITNERLRLGNPVYPAIPFRSCFFFRSVSSSRINYKLILEPFSSEVWHYVVLFGIVSINITVLLSIFQDSKLSDKYINAIILNISAFCQQGVDYKNNQSSGRIALLFIFIFNLLLNNYYMASLVSNRLRNYQNKINDSMHQLTKVHLDFAAEKALYFDFYMKRNDWEIKSFYSNVWVKIPDNKKFLEPKQAMPLVAKGGFAYHTTPETAYPHIERFFDDRKICQITEVHLVRPTQLSFLVSKNSSFTEMMKCGFAKLTEKGIRNREVLRWLARKPNCRVDVLTIEKVTFDEVVPLILFMFLSIILAFKLLVLEKVLYHGFWDKVINLLTKIKW